jgi:hypothetical protein
LLVDVILVVGSAGLAVGAESEGPVNDADPVIRFGVGGFLFDVLLVVGLGFFKFIGIVGSAGHLKEDGADAIDGAEIIGIDRENILEFRDRLIAEANVLFGRRAGNVLAGISSGQVEAGIHQLGIEILGLFEILDRRVVLSFFVGGDTFIKKIARFQFAAAGDTERENEERRKG